MQLIINFTSNGISLPISHQRDLQGLIYNALATNPEYSSFLHDNGYAENMGRTFKLFTFGKLNGHFYVKNKVIYFENNFSLEVRSPDERLIYILQEYFVPGRPVDIYNQHVTVADSMAYTFVSNTDRLHIQMLTPIVVRSTPDNKHSVFHSPYEDIFYERIKNNACRKINSVYLNAEDVHFDIIPLPNQEFKRLVTQFKSTYITAWYGDYEIFAPPKYLSFIHDTGLGEKNSQGFGMFRVVE